MTDRRLKALKPLAANEIPPVSPAVATAIKALHSGTAEAHQQQLALEWILRDACGRAHSAFHPTDRDTTYALGRHFVADAIVGLINADLSTLRRASSHVPEPKPTRPAKP